MAFLSPGCSARQQPVPRSLYLWPILRLFPPDVPSLRQASSDAICKKIGRDQREARLSKGGAMLLSNRYSARGKLTVRREGSIRKQMDSTLNHTQEPELNGPSVNQSYQFGKMEWLGNDLLNGRKKGQRLITGRTGCD